jgi:hypothetical protein
MDIQQIFPSGAYYIGAIIDGHLTRRTYLDYEQREAVESFAAEFGLDLSEELLPCQTCHEMIPAETWLEELNFCLPCSNAYFTHEDEEATA